MRETRKDKRPLQVYLTHDMLDVLEHHAERTDQTVSALVRKALNQYITTIPISKERLKQVRGF